MIDLVALDAALHVLEHGSFRRAAAVLGVRPSVVQRRVRALEDSLGVSLFQRQSQGAQPTLAGRRFLADGRVILGDIARLESSAGRRGVAEEGSLRIGVIASIAGGTSRGLLEAFIVAHPGVEVEITEGAARDHFAAVRAMRMDLVFSAGGTPAAGCETGPGWAEPIQVAVPTNHRLAGATSLTWADLADERFIVSKMDPGPEIADCVVRHLTTIGREPMIEPRGVQRDGLLAMVSLGLGIGLFTSAEAHVTHPGVVFIPLEEEWLPFTLVWSAKNDNPALRRFLSLARLETQRRQAQAKAPGAGAPSRTPDPPP